jgi:hypothetical protein
LAIAFKDISEKAGIINNNQKQFLSDLKLATPECLESIYIQNFVALEASLKCQALNEDDNKKTIKGMNAADVKPWF